ncbi:energy-coupling factor ABC transporter permease [Halopseudomonas salegens]|uniref:Uncharacterized membrane protein n=1 Tax=Halopseudomonas salegens TaxID=1434072 RepID=A0A1H2GZ21_9GAMM|nr:energy-coupling factor ABC transporter permease [Halopseudomonas salegens]SDU24771.1 Uncharacterized membrane protein [Halopseudomonas salegens]
MFTASLLTTVQVVLTLAMYLALLGWALIRVRWVELLADSRRQHLLFGAALFLLLMWLVRREFDNGLTFHFLGMTAVVLLLNWPLAVVAGTLAQLLLLVLGQDELAGLGANALIRIGLPVLVTMLVWQVLERWQPRNLFVYIFVCGFFGAALAGLASLLGAMFLLWWSGALGELYALWEYFAYLLLILFPEAFVNGMLIAGLVVFYPQWVDTFDDDRYLQEPFDPPPES